MAAGGPGDHPLTDVVKYNIDVFNQQCDTLIREIAKFVSLYELSEMFDWFSITTNSKSELEEFEIQLKVKLQELREKAEKGGWEL
jgi:hypothetical protein